MRTRSYLSLVGIVSLGLASTGCVNVDKYEAIRLERDGLREQLDRAQSDVSAANAKAASFKMQVDQLIAQGPNSTALVKNLTEQNAMLQAQLADYDRRYNDLVNKIGQGPALPAALTNELTAFADANADLIDFDAERGIVKFKSDVTFASGDAAVTAQGREVLAKFSQILNATNARSYELLIAGHTDNKPVGNPITRQKHPNNWYLSSHRAISVSEELIRSGVSARRIGAVGYADQRPVASNETPTGMAANRRVEVLILPSQIGDTMAAPAAEPARPAVAPAAPAPNPALNK